MDGGDKMQEPTRNEDAKNLSTIVGAGLLTLAATVALFARAAPPAEVVYAFTLPTPQLETFTPAPVEIDEPDLVEPRVPAPVVTAPLDDRLYGKVVTRSGREYEGYIRWDRNEGSWADLLDAHKRGRHSTISGIRFGHIQRIEVLNSRAAVFTLKSGREQTFSARSTDLGSGLRALIVDDARRGRAEFKWRDLDVIEFMAAPAGVHPENRRLYGTMVTRSGAEFTGFIAWDVDEIYSDDVLDGEDRDGVDREIPFGNIASIERESSRSARVVLEDGEEMILRGSKDVNRSNRGISVSDPALGQVKVSWNNFREVRFSGIPARVHYDLFDGGRRIHGTVLTDSGEELTGDIMWDNDEEYTWEMLNGKLRGVEFDIEFSKIVSITQNSHGARVRLEDGRTFDLSGSNDVDDRNRGIRVRTDDGRTHRIDWCDFVELRIHP